MQIIRLSEENMETGRFHLESRCLGRTALLRPGTISITTGVTDERGEITEFIENTFRRRHDARIAVDYRKLISLRSDSHDLLAAAGFRFAGSDQLFLEQYTPAPVEELLDTPRNRIVEIGNLASAGNGGSLLLFLALASFLGSLGASHAVMTGTAALARYLAWLGLAPQPICPASSTALGNTAHQWGSYYDNQPFVMSGEIQPACRHLRSLFGRRFFQRRPKLFPRLRYNEPA